MKVKTILQKNIYMRLNRFRLNGQVKIRIIKPVFVCSPLLNLYLCFEKENIPIHV